MNREDKYKAIHAIKKLYDESINRDFSVETNSTGEDVFWETNKVGFVVKYDGYTLAFAKSTHKDKDCIRILCAIRTKTKIEEDGEKVSIRVEKKVKIIEYTMEFISIVEDALTYVDECKIYEIRDFVYIDMIKLLNK